MLTINDIEFDTKIMVSSKDKENGMMGKKFNNPNQGMLFIMEPGEHCFWMKNCIIPLDILFIDNNIITEIYSNCPPCDTKECMNYCGVGDLILELPSGTCKKLDIKKGDSISFI